MWFIMDIAALKLLQPSTLPETVVPKTPIFEITDQVHDHSPSAPAVFTQISVIQDDNKKAIKWSQSAIS